MRAGMLLSLSVLSILMACASVPDQHWEHQAKGPREFHKDRAECAALANSGGSTQQILPGSSPFLLGYNLSASQRAAEERDQIFCDCMAGRGWVLMNNK